MFYWLACPLWSLNLGCGFLVSVCVCVCQCVCTIHPSVFFWGGGGCSHGGHRSAVAYNLGWFHSGSVKCETDEQTIWHERQTTSCLYISSTFVILYCKNDKTCSASVTHEHVTLVCSRHIHPGGFKDCHKGMRPTQKTEYIG